MNEQTKTELTKSQGMTYMEIMKKLELAELKLRYMQKLFKRDKDITKLLIALDSVVMNLDSIK